MTNRYCLLLIIFTCPGFEPSVDPDSWVDNADETYKHYETRGKEMYDEFQGILKMKRTNERLDTQYEKKKRYHGYQHISCPPEARAHRSSPFEVTSKVTPY